MSTEVTRQHTRTYGSVPGGAVEDRPQVEEEHGDDASGTELVGNVARLCWLGNGDVGSDGIHRKGTTDTSYEQHCATTESIHEPEQPNNCAQELDDTEDTGSEKRRVCTGDTDRFEDRL